jgi:tetratricopeptide (TPR) repeat protein
MTRPLRLTASLLAIVLALSIGAPAAAQPAPADDDVEGDVDRARELFYQGQKLFGLRRFDKALVKFEAAFEAAPIPDFLFNIGQCHRNLGNYDEAIFSFRRFLKLKPDAPRRAQIEELIRELEAERAAERERRRRLPIVGPPPPRKSKPVYKRWWFWTGVAAVAAGTTAAIVLSGDSGGLPDTDLGNLDFGR